MGHQREAPNFDRVEGKLRGHSSRVDAIELILEG